jgi:hypothetical protein
MPSVLLAPVPHDEATAFIRSKPVVSREVFDGLVPELKARAITVTGIENANVVQNVRDRIADLPQGADWDAVKSDLVDQISPWLRGGEEGGAAAERRAETLMRAHGFQAYSGAMDQVMDRQKAAFPYAMYITADDDKCATATTPGRSDPSGRRPVLGHAHRPVGVMPLLEGTLAADEVDEIRAAEADKPVEERRVLEGPRLEALSKNNQITVATSGGTPRTVSVSPSKTFTFDSKSLRLSADEIQQRYSPEAWKTFETWAGKQDLGGGVSVLDWMKGATVPGATPAPAPAPATPKKIEKPAPAEAPKTEIPATKATAPAGTPVSKALSVRSRKAPADIQTAITAIDAVHGDGDLPKLPIYAKAGRGNLGEFVHRGSEAVQIGIKPDGSWPALTTAHELGHFLDHQVLGTGGKWGSANSEALAAFRAAVEGSETVKTIQALPESIGAYWLTKHELWARAYAQYVATRSGDATLLAQLEKARGGLQPWRQWSDADFKPIAEAIDALFREKGWIK